MAGEATRIDAGGEKGSEANAVRVTVYRDPDFRRRAISLQVLPSPLPWMAATSISTTNAPPSGGAPVHRQDAHGLAATADPHEDLIQSVVQRPFGSGPRVAIALRMAAAGFVLREMREHLNENALAIYLEWQRGAGSNFSCPPIAEDQIE